PDQRQVGVTYPARAVGIQCSRKEMADKEVNMIRLLSLQRFVCISMMCFLCTFCSGQTPRNISRNGGAQTASRTHSDTGRFFFGISQEQNAKHCASAWLLYLNKDHQTGEIFVLASMEKFTKFELGKDGTLVLQWSGFGDDKY